MVMPLLTAITVLSFCVAVTVGSSDIEARHKELSDQLCAGELPADDVLEKLNACPGMSPLVVRERVLAST